MFFDDSRPDRRKRADKNLSSADKLKLLQASPIPPAKEYELFELNEILNGGYFEFVFDVESYPNYWECGFKCLNSSKVIYFEDTPAGYFINGVQVEFETWRGYITYILYRCLIIGFNSKTYDLPVVLCAIKGMRAPELFLVSVDIIQNDMQAYMVERKYKVEALYVNHIDVMEVAPLNASLKLYGGRLHKERLQDLPFPFDTHLTPEQSYIVRDYNINDLDLTEGLYLHIKKFIELREQLGKEYEEDLRSKSDAQVAERIIAIELEKLGYKSEKITWETGDQFQYKPPEWVSFKTPEFQRAFEIVKNSFFTVGSGGHPQASKEIEQALPKLGIGTYRLGNGGLHSSEESCFHVADENTLIIDRDVASYYPFIILNNGFAPEHLGQAFLDVYRSIVERRLKLKKAGDSLEAGLKIAINGIFGKLGNKYSLVYSPNLLIQVTVTGQLALLMLIEAIELAGIPVVSANTDGIVIKCPKERYDDLENVIIMWEGKTGFVTEETRYKAIYSRDVNNYIAIKEDNSCKVKGCYSERGSAQNSVLSKNPESLICSEAVQAYLVNGTPIEETIDNCTDFTKFVSVRNVKGGGQKDGVYLGKVVRWYYAIEETGTINYIGSGNQVARSEGAKPCMIMPTMIPNDLDRARYINDAHSILFDIGVKVKPEKATLI